MPTLTLPPFPNVPNVPGVPPVLRPIESALLAPVTTAVASAEAQVKGLLAGFGITFASPPKWGIFDTSGKPVLTGDNVVAFDYRREFRVATAPVEGGSFSSYNKVETPFDVSFTFTKGGSTADRSAFLVAVKALLESTKLFVGVVPEGHYSNVNIVHADLRRTARAGATLLTVEIGCQLIRQTPPAAFSNTQQPQGSATQNTGPVQSATPTTQQSTAINSTVEPPPGS